MKRYGTRQTIGCLECTRPSHSPDFPCCHPIGFDSRLDVLPKPLQICYPPTLSGQRRRYCLLASALKIRDLRAAALNNAPVLGSTTPMAVLILWTATLRMSLRSHRFLRVGSIIHLSHQQLTATGCFESTIIPILVSPNGDGYECSAIDSQADGVEQRSSW